MISIFPSCYQNVNACYRIHTYQNSLFDTECYGVEKI